MPAENKSDKEVEGLQESLEVLKNTEGVIGYILRGSESASIDLKDPREMINYAMLSSKALETGKETADMFEIGEVENILLEGEKIKVLSLVVRDHTLSVFMDRKVDHKRLRKELNLT